MDLDKLAETLVNINPDTYPDYTKDWKTEELQKAIKKGDESEDAFSSPEEHEKFFALNPR